MDLSLCHKIINIAKILFSAYVEVYPEFLLNV